MTKHDSKMGGIIRGSLVERRKEARFAFMPLGQRDPMKKILLVEDHVPFRQYLGDLLRSQFPQVEVEEATDGQETFRMMKSGLPDVVVMDIRLPGENGLTLTRRIKDQYPQVAVIILTNYDSVEYREAAMKYRADRYFLKDSIGTELMADLATRLSVQRA
jgi:DNA-binding NarL/FixJ family response regulator